VVLNVLYTFPWGWYRSTPKHVGNYVKPDILWFFSVRVGANNTNWSTLIYEIREFITIVTRANYSLLFGDSWTLCTSCAPWPSLRHVLHYDRVCVELFEEVEPGWLSRRSDKAIGWTNEKSLFDYQRGNEGFVFSEASRRTVGSNSVPAAIPSWVKWPGRDTLHSPPSNAEIGKDCSYTFPLLVFVACIGTTWFSLLNFLFLRVFDPEFWTPTHFSQIT
jgi:hypothetical protein